MKTFSAKENAVKREWFLVDAEGKTLGRLASQLAHRLRGKHKPEYTPHIDTGDYFVVINAAKIKVTGKKFTDKFYYRSSGRIGGLKQASFKEMMTKHPERIISLAVKGMLPKGPLGRKMKKKLKIFAGNEHKHQAQKPASIELL